MANPTDLVKVRMQAEGKLPPGAPRRYPSALGAYKTIARTEGIAALWTGLGPNVGRNAIINAAELASYDAIKQVLLGAGATDGVPVHLAAGLGAGFFAVVCGSPVDVVKSRIMGESWVLEGWGWRGWQRGTNQKHTPPHFFCSKTHTFRGRGIASFPSKPRPPVLGFKGANYNRWRFVARPAILFSTPVAALVDRPTKIKCFLFFLVLTSSTPSIQPTHRATKACSTARFKPPRKAACPRFTRGLRPTLRDLARSTWRCSWRWSRRGRRCGEEREKRERCFNFFLINFFFCFSVQL